MTALFYQGFKRFCVLQFMFMIIGGTRSHILHWIKEGVERDRERQTETGRDRQRDGGRR